MADGTEALGGKEAYIKVSPDTGMREDKIA